MNDKSDSEKNNQLDASTELVVNPCDRTTLLKTVTNDPPHHANATARIFVEGLSVFMFNANRRRAELGFLAYTHSPLKMQIYKNGNCNPWWSTERWDDFPHHTNNTMITINANKTGMGTQYEDASMPDEDFRHMQNLAQWHGRTELPVLPTAKQQISSRVNIHDAVFYTHKKSVSRAYRRTKPPTNEHDLNKIGRIMGADIFNAMNESIEIKIKLQDGAMFTVPPLLNNGSDKYVITLKTSPFSEIDNHFFLLYKVLRNPDPQEFYLRFGSREPHLDDCRLIGLTEEEAHDHSEKDKENRHKKATEYACQVFGGGCGELPDLP